VEAKHPAVLSHLGICVADIELSRKFYCEGLGFEFDRASKAGNELRRLFELEDDIEVETRFLRNGGTMIELMQFKSPLAVGSSQRAPMNRRGLAQLAFTVSDIDVVADRLNALGGTVLRETRTTLEFPGLKVNVISCSDPDGVRIKIASATPWPTSRDPRQCCRQQARRYYGAATLGQRKVAQSAQVLFFLKQGDPRADGVGAEHPSAAFVAAQRLVERPPAPRPYLGRRSVEIVDSKGQVAESILIDRQRIARAEGRRRLHLEQLDRVVPSIADHLRAQLHVVQLVDDIHEIAMVVKLVVFRLGEAKDVAVEIHE
jgi:lactoylglutathione lyase